MRPGLFSTVSEFASRLRFPKLVALTLALLLVDIAVPDLVPFVDEILLALLTALLASFKKRSGSGAQRQDRKAP
jgi:hypothetical protein